MTRDEFNDAMEASSIPEDVLDDYTKTMIFSVAASPGWDYNDCERAVFFAGKTILDLEKRFLSDSPSKHDKQRFVIELLSTALAVAKGERKVP